MTDSRDFIPPTQQEIRMQRRSQALEIFDTEIQSTYGNSNDLDLATKENLGDLLSKGLDAGVGRTTYYKSPDGTVHTEGPVFMLNRSGFVFKLNSQLLENPTTPLNIMSFDVNAVKFMDQRGAADWNLNRVANRLQTVVAKYPGVFAGRYAGDEFTVALPQGVDAQLITREIETAIQSLTWQVNIDTKNLDLHLGLKSEVIVRPDDPLKRQIFDYFLKEGQLLTAQDLEDIDINELTERFPSFTLAEMYDRHPEYATVIKNTNQNKKREDFVHRVIDRVVYDPKLRAPVVTFPEFMDDMNSGEIGEVLFIESKYMKEANKQSFIQGDKLVEQVYGGIRSALGENFDKKFKLARRGGGWIIGVRSDIPREEREQAKEQLEDLSQAASLGFTYKQGSERTEITLNIPIGTYMRTGNEGLRELREHAEINWYFNYFGTAKGEQVQNLGIVREKLAYIRQFVNEAAKLPQKDRLLEENFFLEPKRALGRVKTMIRAITHMIGGENIQLVRPELRSLHSLIGELIRDYTNGISE